MVLIKNVLFYNGKHSDILLGEKGVEKTGKISAKGEEKINGKKYLALPSFKNYHTHLAMTLFKGFSDDLPLTQWLEDNIWPAEARLNPSFIEAGSSLGLLELAKSGVSYFNDMYFWPDITAKITEKFGLRATVSSLFLDFGNLEKHEKDINHCLETQRKISKLKNVSFALSPHSPYTVGSEAWKFISRFSQQESISINTHLAETKKEVLEFKKKNKISEIQFLKKHRILNNHLFASHCIYLSPSEIFELGKSKINVVYNSSSNMKLSSGSFNYPAFRSSGSKIFLGTDGSASNNSLSMFSEMKFAALHQKLVYGSSSVSSEEILKSACCSENLVVRKGMQDIILLPLDENLLPLNSISSSVVYSGGKVDYLFVKGRMIVDSGKVKNEKKILKNAEKASRKLLNRKN